MKALVYTGPSRVEIQDVPTPSPGPGEVLLKIHQSGICGSDIHGFLGHSERRKPGLILGHEAIATVLEPHPTATGWKAGQRVVVNPLTACGACPMCLAGRQNLCAHWKVLGLDRVHGTYAEFIALPANQLYPISDQLRAEEAVFTEPLANICHFFRMTMPEIPDSMAILGAGAIGALTLTLAKIRGIPKVAVVDRNPRRLEVAGKLGADRVVHADQEDAVKAVRDFTGEGAEYVVDTAGFEASRRQAVNACRRGGRVLFIGMTEMESSLPWIEMIRDEKTVLTTFCYAPRDFKTSLALIEAKKLDLTPWTEIRPLSDGQAGFLKMAHDPGATLKMVFTI